jgi:hypothetical protein
VVGKLDGSLPTISSTEYKNLQVNDVTFNLMCWVIRGVGTAGVRLGAVL